MEEDPLRRVLLFGITSIVEDLGVWSVIVNFLAVDEDAANHARDEIEAALRLSPFLGSVAVSDVAIVAPLVTPKEIEDE